MKHPKDELMKHLKVDLERERDTLESTLETLGLEARQIAKNANLYRLAGNEVALDIHRRRLNNLNRRLSETRRRLRQVKWELEDRFGEAC